MSILADLRGKRVLILGFGREGSSTLRFLQEQGGPMELGVADRRTLSEMSAEEQAALASLPASRVGLGPSYLDAIASADVIVRSPGMPPDAPPLQQARSAGKRITSLVNLFFDVAPGRIIGVTGTKGKSTTTSAISTVLRDAGLDTRLGGNIGIPLLSCLDGTNEQTVFVVELSSYQLSDLERSPHVAVFHDMMREHLDYHGSFEAYVDAKANIARHQRAGDFLVYDAGHAIPREVAQLSEATRLPFSLEPRDESSCFVDGGWLVVREHGVATPVLPINDVPLPGAHNLLNVMPSIVVGRLLGAEVQGIAASLRTLRQLPHRLQIVHQWRGRDFYDDSLSTVPESAMAALSALGDRPKVLIAGGHDRSQEWSALAQAILRANVRAVVLLPELGQPLTGQRLTVALESAAAAQPGVQAPRVLSATTMVETVRCAIDASEPGTAILLSPAAASYGVFRNYEDRGQQFLAAAIQVCSEADGSPASS